MLIDFRLKIRNFWRKYKYFIVIGLLMWLIIIIVNNMLKNNKTPVTPSISYSPHEAIMDKNSKVPSNITSKIEKWMNSFYTACNNKEYEKAYNLLSNEYRKNHPLNELKSYIDNTFNENKIYVIQDYSNKSNIYLYKVKLMEDIMSTGLTGKENLEYTEDMVVIKKNGNNIEVSLGNDILEETLNKAFENEYIKVTLTKKVTKYDKEIYTVRIANRTDYTIVINDYANINSVKLDLGDIQKNISSGDSEIIVEPESTYEIEMPFDKFFDDGRKAKALKFEAVRVFEDYEGYKTTDDAIRKFEFTINL